MTQNTKTHLYKTTTSFVLSFLVVTAVFITWALLRPISISDDNKYYVSAIDMKILNDTLAPSIIKIDDTKEIPPITLETLHKSIAQDSVCLAAFNKADKWKKIVNNLQILQEKVTKESKRLKQGGRLEHLYTLDANKWIQYACAILGNTEPETGLAIKPMHLNNALTQLAKIKSEVFVSGNVYWCEKEAYRNKDNCKLPNWGLEFNNTLLAVKNPWSGLKGCLLLHDKNNVNSPYYFLSGRKVNPQISQQINKICTEAISNTSKQAIAIAIKEQALANTLLKLDDTSWMLPPSYAEMLQPMQGLRLAQPLRKETENGEIIDLLENNMTELNGKDRQIGLHTELTFQPQTQALAQQISMCYTGHQDICNALKLNSIQNEKFYENATVRKVGIVVLDAPTGEINVLASANSRCFTQDHQGISRSKDCPIPSYNPKWDESALRNHAYFDEAPPASTVKPMMAVTFLQDPTRTTDIKQLGRELAHSDSEAFLRRMFCLAADSTDCPIAQQIQQTAISMGWDSNCNTMSVESYAYDCGKVDSLWGKHTPINLGDYNQDIVLNRPALYGWFMVEKHGNPKILRTDFRFAMDEKRSTSGKEWYINQTPSVRDLSNDGLGQGESFVSPIGVAGMLANLVLAEHQQSEQPLPHIIRRLFDVQAKELELLQATKPDHISVTIPPKIARQVLVMMQGNHKGTDIDHGTGYNACKTILGATACNNLTSVAGKTGTPTVKDKQNTQTNLVKNGGCKKECYRPYKWYMAAYKSHAKLAYYDKVIVVLVERNWQINGQLPNDEYNHAAEIAFSLMKASGAVH